MGNYYVHPFLPHTEKDRNEILSDLSIESSDELFEDIPSNLRINKEMDLPDPMSELEIKKHIQEIASRNKSMEDYISFLGGGIYDHYIPAVVNHVIGRSEFYTSYTPYQPEVSQGVLQSMFEYQTMIAQLTGMDLANASIYDGATATAEAAIRAIANTKRDEIIISATVNPVYREVIRTYLEGQGFSLKILPHVNGSSDISSLKGFITDDTACVILQNPNFFGVIEDYDELKKIMEDSKALFIAVCDPISLSLIEPPSKWGADIVVGDGQSLGNPTSFGGPLLGYFAAKNKFLRRMPGRMIGETKDKDGKTGYVMTLQTREQHIRREKATSNICSNQALNVIAACVYLSVMGPEGLREVAYQSAQKAHYARNMLRGIDGLTLMFDDKPYFKEFLVKLSRPVDEVQSKLLDKGIFAGINVGEYYEEFEGCMLLSFTEQRKKAEIDYLVETMGEVL